MEKTSLSKIIKFVPEKDTAESSAATVVSLFQCEASEDGFNPLERLINESVSSAVSAGQSQETELQIKKQEAEALLDAARQEAEALKKEAKKQLSEAEQIVKQKQAEAAGILEKANKRADEIEQQAYNAAFAQGKKDGEQLGLKEYQAKAKRLEGVLEEIASLGDAILKRYETELVLLCIELARAVLMHEARTSPETIISVLKSAVNEAVEGSRLEIHLNPTDARLLPESLKQELKKPGAMPIAFLEDDAVSQGGCFIETDFGVIDATTQKRWQAVRDTMEKMLDKSVALLISKSSD